MSSSVCRGISRDYLGWDRSVWSSRSLLEDDDVNVDDGDNNDNEEEESFGYDRREVSSSSLPCV